ncbi:flagellar motor switch protein FliM [Luminiphilus sp.]|jgi:flagellar motor switch protein FliM|nr:flagellar motor switch protein FliM [Halieaceae bacterium]MDA8553824.1 flagellar motor switch protein FliM [Luminiphilus sp.]MDB2364982.1 flagellar motor switch protein FliM [Luminiphilus sp.]MDB2687832.1 flagellar motor switch protein FliM [Luminiphilus sp.]
MAEDSSRLSEEELNALTFDEGFEEDSGSLLDPEAALGSAVRPHNLVTEDTTIGINLAAVDMITERFTRHLRLGLMEVLRTSPRITADRVKTLPFSEYLKDLKAPLSVNTVRLSGLRGTSMVVIDPNVVFASLDNFFGGFGRGIDGLPPGRMFTPTETRIINIMLEVIFASIHEAWSPIMEINCEHIGSEINPAFVQIVDENDLVIVCHLEVELSGKERGAVDIVYPFATLKPIRDILRGRVQDSEDPSVDHDVWARELAGAASDAELEHRVILGEIDLTLGDFNNMQPGDILDLKKYDTARVLVDDIPLFDADVGTANGYVAARLLKAVEPE